MNALNKVIISMIEPTIISVPDLAERWEQSPHQILDHAMQLKLPILFLFDGLAIEIDNRWLLGHGAFDEEKEFDRTKELVKDWKARIALNTQGAPDEFERLSRDDLRKLRLSIEEKQERIEELDILLRDRERQRLDKEYRGYIRALPETLHQLSSASDVSFPSLGVDPACPIKLAKFEGRMVWDGRILRLEPGTARWKPTLSRDDLVVPMDVVKQLEAPQDDPDAPERYLNKSQTQEKVIIEKLVDMGYEPKAIPKEKTGCATVKSEIRKMLMESHYGLFNGKKFEKAWERLRANGEIADKE